MSCKFELAWRGSCNAESFGTHCAEHADLKCESCGNPATHECEEIIGGSICTANLCDNCGGTLMFNSGNQTHSHKKLT